MVILRRGVIDNNYCRSIDKSHQEIQVPFGKLSFCTQYLLCNGYKGFIPYLLARRCSGDLLVALKPSNIVLFIAVAVGLVVELVGRSTKPTRGVGGPSAGHICPSETRANAICAGRWSTSKII